MSMLKVECTHCHKQIDMADIDQHEAHCLDVLNQRVVEDLIHSQDLLFEREEEDERRINLHNYGTTGQRASTNFQFANQERR